MGANGVFYRVGVPLIVVALLALILLAWVLIYRRRRDEFEEEKALKDETERWTGICPISNPETGAECQREEYHTTNHYRVVNDKMITWL